MDGFPRLTVPRVLGVILLTVCMTQPALAYDPWEWRAPSVSASVTYDSEAGALAAMRSRTADHQYLTQLAGVEVDDDSNWTTYKYVAPDAAGVPQESWVYGPTVCSDPYYGYVDCNLPDQEEAVAAYRLRYGLFSDPECLEASVEWSGAYTPGAYVGGVSTYEQGRLYVVRMWQVTGPNNACSEVLSEPVQMFRSRSVACPLPYTQSTPAPESSNSPCRLALEDVVQRRPLSDDACEATPNPITVANGDKTRREVDYENAGLTFERTYHSLDPRLSSHAGLGPGWTHNFASRLIIGKRPVTTVIAFA